MQPFHTSLVSLNFFALNPVGGENAFSKVADTLK